MHRFLKPECIYQGLLFSINRNLQSQEYMTVFEQMWRGVNQPTQEIQLQSGQETNRQGLAALWLKNVFFLPTDLFTYSPFYSDTHDAVTQRYIDMVMFLIPQFHYVTGRVGLYPLAQWKGTKQLSGIMELLASFSIQAQDRTGTEVFKLSEAQWRSLYHTETSFIFGQATKYAFLKNLYKAISQCFGNCSTGEDWQVAVFIICKVTSMTHSICPSNVTQNEYLSLRKVNSES